MGRVTLSAVAMLLDKMGVVVARHVNDLEIVQAIACEWQEIQIDPKGREESSCPAMSIE